VEKDRYYENDGGNKNEKGLVNTNVPFEVMV
jgi:hypothetical protein